MSEGSEVMDGSVVSSVTDKYGFLASETEGGDLEGVDLEILRRRESKWLEMLTEWDSYMMKNYKKVVVLHRILRLFISFSKGAGEMSERDSSEREGSGLAPSLRSQVPDGQPRE